MALDSASGGSFSEKTVKEGEILIEKLARSGRDYDDETNEITEEKDEGEVHHNLEMLNDKLDKILGNQESYKRNCYLGSPDVRGNTQQEVFRIETATVQHPPCKTRLYPKEDHPENLLASIREEVTSTVEAMKSELEEMIQGVMSSAIVNQNFAIKKVDATTANLDERMNTWECKQEDLLMEIKQLSYSINSMRNATPTEGSSKATAKALTLRNNKILPEFVAPIPKGNHRSVPELNPPCDLPQTTLLNPQEKVATPEGKNEKEINPHVQRKGQDHNLPFPSRLRKLEAEKHMETFRRLISGINVSIPLLELIESSPYYTKAMKDLISRKKDFKINQVEVSHQCCAVLANVKPRKLSDPGSFTLPCSVRGFYFDKCLVDLGASVSLMPLTVSRRLGLTNFKETRVTLILADRSVRCHVGILEDVPLKLGNA